MLPTQTTTDFNGMVFGMSASWFNSVAVVFRDRNVSMCSASANVTQYAANGNHKG